MNWGVMDTSKGLLFIVATFPTYAAAADWIEYRRDRDALMVVEMAGGDS